MITIFQFIADNYWWMLLIVATLALIYKALPYILEDNVETKTETKKKKTYNCVNCGAIKVEGELCEYCGTYDK